MERPAANRLFWVLMGLLFVASLAKHTLTFATGPTVIINDAAEYWDRGARSLQGDWLQLADRVDYRTPLYPMFLGIMQGLFGEYALMATVIAQHALHMCCGLMTAFTCYQLSRSRLVTLTGYAVSVACVTRAWWANVALTGSLFMFFLTATMAMLATYYRRPTALRLAAVGALLGAATLVRPIPQMLWLPLFAVVFLQPRASVSSRRIWMHIGAGVTGLFLVLSPAMVRNYRSLDHAYVARVPPINKWVVCFHDGSAADLPIPQTHAGRRLMKLVPELGSGNQADRSGYTVIARLKERGLSDSEIDALLTQTCFDAIQKDPGVFFWKAFKRLGNFWRCSVGEFPYYSTYALDDPSLHRGQKTWRIEPLASWTEPVMERTFSRSVRWLEIDFVACMIGTFLMIRRPDTQLFGLSLAMVFIYFPSITALLEIESYRYRYVLEPYIVVAIVAGIFGTRDYFQKHEEEKPVAPTSARAESSSLALAEAS